MKAKQNSPLEAFTSPARRKPMRSEPYLVFLPSKGMASYPRKAQKKKKKKKTHTTYALTTKTPKLHSFKIGI